MKRTIAVSLFLLGLAIGCVTATVSQNVVVPKVRAGTNPTRWEYQCNQISAPSIQDINNALNAMGDQGWEFFSQLSNSNLLCYKRPLDGAAPAAPAQAVDPETAM